MLAIWKKVEDGETLFKNSKTFREKLSGMLTNKQRSTTTEVDYDTPSWSHKQAHQNGYNQAIREVLKLLGE